ncbi:MAG: DnaA/Hda family protein [Planctomycetota bacterium]
MTSPQRRDRTAPTDELRRTLTRAVGEPSYARYFDGQTRFDLDDGRTRVATPSRFHSAVLDRRFGPQIRAALSETLGRPPAEISLDFAVDKRLSGDSTEEASPKRNSTAPALQRRGPAKRAPRDAEPFLVGECNRLAYDAVCRLCDDDHARLSPLVVHGPCGVGKTHLLNTAAAMFEKARSGAGVRTMTADAFTTGFVTAIREGKVDRFRNRIRSLDLLCLDDTHFLSSRDATQGELVQTLDAVGVSGARILLASDEHPRKITSLRAALRSRLLSGMVVHIAPPDRSLARGLTQLFAQRHGVELTDDAAGTLVSIVARQADGSPSVRELMGAVNKLVATRSLLKDSQRGPVGIGLIRHALDAGGDQHKPRGDSFQGIAQAVCDELGVDPAELGGKKRHKRLVAARAAITVLCRERTTLSYPDIARAMHKPSHSTVITAAQRLLEQIGRGETVNLGACPPPHLDGLTAEAMLSVFRDRLGH